MYYISYISTVEYEVIVDIISWFILLIKICIPPGYWQTESPSNSGWRPVKRIDDYRYENRIPDRNKAIRRLLDEVLKKYEKKGKE